MPEQPPAARGRRRHAQNAGVGAAATGRRQRLLRAMMNVPLPVLLAVVERKADWPAWCDAFASGRITITRALLAVAVRDVFQFENL